MACALFVVDAFADRPFQGNPAAVCLPDGPAGATWMQRVAAEMNLSETAFIEPQGAAFGLRWFTPTVEVDLCGHATLASAHVLWEQGHVAADEPIAFETRSGVLTCRPRADRIELDFPAEPARPAPPAAELVAALGATPVWLGRNRFDYLVQLESEAAVRGLRPDFARLAQIACRGCIVTAPSDDPRFDFVSRFFAPAVGVDEDPVCGSAHCCLAPFWSERLGRGELAGHQVSARGGIVGVRVAGQRVMISGTAVTVLAGHLVDGPADAAVTSRA